MPHRTLGAVVASLRLAKTVPRPAGESWKAPIYRMHRHRFTPSSRKERTMPMPPPLRHFLSHLNVAERAALPPAEEWKDHVARISVPDRIAEVTEEHYDYWLEVLPPK